MKRRTAFFRWTKGSRHRASSASLILYGRLAPLLRLRMLPTLLALAVAAGPLFAQERRADPKAVALLRQVYEKRVTWGPDFPGFTAKLTVDHQGEEHQGTVKVGKDRQVELHLPNAEAARWAEEALRSIVAHRSARFAEGDGRYPLTLGPEDRHPAGRLVHLNDALDSTYRIREGQIRQINRSAGPKQRFTIDILETTRTEEGKFLSRVYTVSFFDAASGQLLRADTFWDGYRKVGPYHLPEFRRQVTAGDGRTAWKMLRLDDIQLNRTPRVKSSAARSETAPAR